MRHLCESLNDIVLRLVSQVELAGLELRQSDTDRALNFPRTDSCDASFEMWLFPMQFVD